MQRHELTDEQWEIIKDLFPEKKRSPKGGRPPKPTREVLNGVFWILNTGAPWRDLPARYGNWKSVYHRFNAWCKDGTIEKAMEALQLKLDRNGYIDWSLWCIDGTNIRAARAAAGAGEKGGSTNRGIMPLGAAGAGLGPKSTWSLTVEALPLPPMSQRGKSTNRRSSKRR